jgi:hypothetical protein
VYTNPCTCTPTLRHHVNCATNNTTPGDCDCVPVNVHSAACKADIGVLNCTDPSHVSNGLDDGFNIVVRAAVVQKGVDGMDAYGDAATKSALNSLFAPPNHYVAPTTTVPGP